MQQKIFDLSPEQTTAYIKLMKTKVLTPKNNSTFKTTQTTGQTTKDSALWVLEAMLNYDYDKATSPYQTGLDTTDFNLTTINNNYLSYSDLNNAYVFVAAKINTHLTANVNDKVKVVDVKATQTAGVINVKFEIIYTTNDELGFKTTASPCDPITVSAGWRAPPNNLCVTPFYGAILCNKTLNCSQPNYNCTYGVYFTNVLTVLVDNRNGDQGFYYQNPVVNCAIIQPSDLNYYVSRAKISAIFNKPTTPTNLNILNYRFQDIVNSFPGQFWAIGYWNLYVKYGVPNCSPANPN